MAPSFCTDLSVAERQHLLEIARQSIESGLERAELSGSPDSQLAAEPATHPGVFVTLTRLEKLRGCMGVLQSRYALEDTVSSCAFNAAFRDPRFARLSALEVTGTQIEISILSPMEALVASDRQNLLHQLRPNIDGLLLADSVYHSTFLPSVWAKVSDADEFLGQLLRKAGLPSDYWSETIQFKRYQVISLTE